MVQSLSDETRTAFELNTTALDALAIDPDTPINLVGQSSVRECIRRLGAALDLTYVVNESTIEITTTEDAQQRLNMRFYDLSYVLPNSANSQALVNAIQQTIGPDTWSASGGTNSISLVGSMMIVSAPDTTHQSIEILLLNISKMNPMNASKPTSQNNSSPGMFGLGGGMGGMGGGMGGMGGGMGGMGGMGGGGMN